MRFQFINRVLIAFTALTLMCTHSRAAIELMELIENNGSIVSGNIVFDQFSLATTGDMTSETIINVETIVDADGNFGIRFQGGLVDFAGGSPSSWTVSYQATALDGTSLFTGGTLAANPAAPVPGVATVTLSAAQIDSSEYLTVFDDFNGGTDFLESSMFASPTSALDVSVEFVGETGDRGAVFASFIDTTFAQGEGVVPEMSSMATWTVLLFGVSLVVAWRKLNDRKQNLAPVAVSKNT